MKLRFFYLLIVVLFSGCAKPPQTDLHINESWDYQQAQLESLTEWSFTGKIGIFTPEGRESANLNWHQTSLGFHIRLTGPLGINVLEIQKVDDNTVIIDGKHYISQDIEQLITQLSGIQLPVNNLQQWIKGNPSEASFELDDNQQVISLLGGTNKNGIWQINYADYRTVNHINLPHKLQLTRGDLRVKIRVSNWKIPLQP